MPADAELWARLGAWSIDGDAAAISFTDRLRREQRWSPDYARRAIEEYKRFLYLACTEAEEMTPSEDVDTVWHLHLVHTRSYWDELCGGVLRRPLHHGPTKGGAGERRRFGGAYGRTLAAYVAVFGTAAPADLWPPEAERFAKTGRMRWVDTGEVWIVRKTWARPALNWRGVLLFMAALILIGGTAEAASGGASDNPFQVLMFGSVGAVLLYFGLQWWRMTPEERAAAKAKNKNGGGCSSGGCSSGGCTSSDGSGGGCSSGGCSGGCGGSGD